MAKNKTSYSNYYLRGSGKGANDGHDGLLGLEPPADENPDVYVYDPLDPVPTLGGPSAYTLREFGTRDQRAIEKRADVLVYTTAVLASDIEVTGPVTMKLYARSSAPDTDFTAKLVDVWPTGEAYILLDGIVRARYVTRTRRHRSSNRTMPTNTPSIWWRPAMSSRLDTGYALKFRAATFPSMTAIRTPAMK